VSAEVIETTDREVEEAAGTRKAVTSHTHNASRPHSIVLCRRRWTMRSILGEWMRNGERSAKRP